MKTFNSNTYRTIYSIIVTLIISSILLTGCAGASNNEIMQYVVANAKVFSSPHNLPGQAWIIMGRDMDGRNWSLTVQQIGTTVDLLKGNIGTDKGIIDNIGNVIKSEGWVPVTFKQLPNVIQLMVLARIQSTIPILTNMAKTTGTIETMIPGVLLNAMMNTGNPDVSSCELSGAAWVCQE